MGTLPYSEVALRAEDKWRNELGRNGATEVEIETYCAKHGCQMAIAGFLGSYVFGPSGFWTMAPLRYAAKLDPFLSLDCAPTPSTLAQSKERKGSNFAA